ncbi:hypothetical protein OF83DRAFT_1058653 [Amylostereum chailletii]|nr:hypothetical protein OF83DRAFT_1058653 [Amylostereum chailletii]
MASEDYERYTLYLEEETETEGWTQAVVDPGVRFRVLILGRANAGKTTILERICQRTVSEAQIYRSGQLRGKHNLADEIAFPSLPGFIFHDSCGIEAGSSNKTAAIERFVKDRSLLMKDKRKQLHAIWYS